MRSSHIYAIFYYKYTNIKWQKMNLYIVAFSCWFRENILKAKEHILSLWKVKLKNSKQSYVSRVALCRRIARLGDQISRAGNTELWYTWYTWSR